MSSPFSYILLKATHSTEQNAIARDAYIELVGKTVHLMEALRDESEGLSLQELATRTNQVKSSVHRILNSLKKHGYVEQESVGSVYRLGLQVLTLARGLNGSVKLVEVARPYLRELREAFDQSTYLAVWRGERGIFVDVQETSRDLRLVGPLGAEVHYHATAAGKAIAAFLPPERGRELLKQNRPTALTENTLTSISAIEKEWSKVRRLGYAVNNEETIIGAIFLAAPVFDWHRQVCGSISVGLPKARYSVELGKRIALHLKDPCRRLIESLTGVGYAH